MAVSLISKDYNTGYCEFSFDNWDEDKDKLPTLNTPGSEGLATIKSCAQGSIAICTDMETVKSLSGAKNEWI